MEYNIRKTGETAVDFFDDAHIATVVHRFFMSDSPYDERPLVNSIEFIRDGHVFLSRGGKHILLEGPTLFWMRRGELFRYIFPKENKKQCEHLFCDFSGEKADRMLAWLEEVCPEGYLQPSAPEKISSIFFEAVNYYRMDPSVYHAEIVECIDRIMLEISRTLRNGSKTLENPYNIRKIGDQIRRNPFQIFDFGRVAAENEITLHHFRLLFRKIHGVSPLEFVRQQKMIRAAELLATTNMRIKEIVYNCKFTNLMDFSRAFKRYSGMSPRDYRKKHGPGNT